VIMPNVSVNTLSIQSSTANSPCTFSTIQLRGQPTSGRADTTLEKSAFQSLGSPLGNLASTQKCRRPVLLISVMGTAASCNRYAAD
jgi:hypothetical protein